MTKNDLKSSSKSSLVKWFKIKITFKNIRFLRYNINNSPSDSNSIVRKNLHARQYRSRIEVGRKTAFDDPAHFP